MLSDSITYLINIAAEFFRIRGASHRACTIVDLAASAVSVLCLVTVTALAMKESIGRLNDMNGEAGSGGGDDEHVNPYVMFGFTAGNLLIDIGMIGSLVLRNRGGWSAVFMCTACRAVSPADDTQHASDTAGAGINANASAIATAQRNAPLLAAEEGVPGVPPEGTVAPQTRAADLNVFSAFAHVIADTMRTVTEVPRPRPTRRARPRAALCAAGTPSPHTSCSNCAVRLTSQRARSVHAHAHTRAQTNAQTHARDQPVTSPVCTGDRR